MDFKIKDGVLEEYTGRGGDVIIPDGVTKLKAGLFRHFRCGGQEIKSITLPASVVEIEEDFTYNWLYLEKINVDLNNPVFEVRNNMLINKNEHKIVLCTSYDKEELVVDDDIKVIGQDAFSRWQRIKTVRLPEGLEKIEGRAFGWNCDVERVYIPNSIRFLEYCYIQTNHTVEIHVNSLEEFIKIETYVFGFDWELYIGEKKVTEVQIPSAINSVSANIFARCKNIKRVVIEEGVSSIGKSAFENCENLEEVTIPNSVSVIGEDAFACCLSLRNVNLPEKITRIEGGTFYGCVSLTSIKIPSKVEYIGEYAFVYTSLSKIDIPKSVIIIEKYAFKGAKRYGDYFEQKNKIKVINVEDGNPVFYSSNGALVEKKKNGNIIVSVPQEGSQEFIISDEITGVREDAFEYTNGSIYMPKNYVPNGTMYNKFVKTIFESGFLKRQVKLPTFCTAALSDEEDCAYSIMYQSGKTWGDAIDDFCKKKEIDVCEIVSKLGELIKQGQKEKSVKQAIEFVLKQIDYLDGETVKKFYLALFETKSKALSILINDIKVQKMLLDGQILPEGKNEKKAYLNPIEKIVRENWKVSDATKKLQSIITSGIRYADSDGISSPEAVIMVIALYAEQLDDAPTHYTSYKTFYVHTHFDKIADQIASGLNKEELQELLEKLAYNDRYRKDGYLLPFGRYASLPQIRTLMTNMREWEKQGDIITRKKVITARGALMLSDYREVMIAIDRVDGLSYYASIRNLDEETLRDSVLAEFGFAENGEKIYDLGGRQVVISLKTDLSLSIFDMGTGKELKSLPKKGTDEKLYEKAKSDLSDLRRNIKKVIANRKNMLFVDYLEAQKYDAESWKKTYIKNPVLNAVACLVVWQQEEKTFVPTREGKLIDYNGMEIKITATDKIKIAHPIELPEKDVIGWQNYFVNNSLKQPFEQIWEPVYHKEDIRKDRYYGCIISIRRFFGKEKHGISVWGFTPYSYDFGFSLKDCELSHTADLERYIPGVDDDGTYELDDFMIKKFTRYTNHIIYLLDKWTIEGRIEKNDATIGNILDGFTVAQITNFISLALEKKSTASLAVLMDYKNKKFNGYDSMQEFTLD